MPVTGDVYTQRDKDDILSFLESELQQEWGEDIDLTQSSVFSTFAEALSELDSEQIEPAIEEVFNAAYLDSAEGDNLDKLVAIIGVDRRAATNATGTVEFRSDGTVTQTHGILNGQTIQTSTADPIEFETTELVSMFLRDDFEAGSLDSDYAGDTGNFSVIGGSGGGDPSPVQGTYELTTDGTAGVELYDDQKLTYIGHTMDFYVYVPAGSQPVVTFGDNGSDRYRIHLDETAGEHRIEKDFSGTESTLQTSSHTITTEEWLRVQVEWLPDNNGTIRSRIYRDTDADDAYDELQDTVEVTGENDIEEGGFGFQEIDGTKCYWDWAADRAVVADARAVSSGTDGNVGANTVTVLTTAPSGVDEVTNRYPMGDIDRYLTNLRNFTEGLPEETDSELRDRAKASEGEIGFATAPAIIAALRGIEDGQVQSVTLFENKTNTDNTGSGGLPPKSFEAVVFGTAPDSAIAEALFETKGFTSRDYGGANGSAQSASVDAENGQSFTMNWSEPTEVTVDMTLDLVVNDTYIGDDEIRDRVIEYVGGVLTDGTEVIGTDVGEDVYIDQLEDAVVGPDDTGVIGVDDGGSSFTPSTTTDGNGLDIISVGSTEVATTNGTDGSITIQTTTV